MTSFTKNELELFEDLFNLNNGHVLNMNRKEFKKFIYRSIDIDITSQDYKNKVKKHRKYFSMPQIYRFIVECEKDKSLKLLYALIDYIDNNNLKRIDEDLLIKAKNILKNKSNDEKVIEQSSKTVDSQTIKRPFPAYDGNDPYIFISYAHKDAEIVFKEIIRFQKEDYNIWYDDELTPGNKWDDGIALALINSSLVVVFITENSISSENVKKEIALASDENINILPIYLKETQLPPGLKYHLIRTNAIFKYSISDEDYLKKYTKAFENINSPKKK